ncbi:GNAT family N-acetyltransferase [Clostridium sp. D2Q-11]|uniref:GNAT family N-acetyltransferase n=1 Tax=Anaeromonas frigoriresistens TaxID=2683708 RepID=A0A942UVS0_9FIRM|nr:GNAT family N-acetyltransferase [Anaeromonas frigoriresistens]MBS4538950.1 GNAT family N-acetyltransferase [Anaeromonas frigoriresistens]
MKIYETDRLYLRTLNIEDIDSVMSFWGDEEVMKYCGGAGNREQEMKSLKFYINLQKEKGHSPYAIILKENNEVIGVCGFNPPDNNEDIELVYHFAKGYWGKGYATEAAIACVNYARKYLNRDTIVAFIDPSNKSSENILIKLGFIFKGVKWHGGSKNEDLYFELTL